MQLVIDITKEDLRIICERTEKEINEEYFGVDKRLIEAVQNGKVIAELKGDKCDNNHDCEHCDWVECPN